MPTYFLHIFHLHVIGIQHCIIRILVRAYLDEYHDGWPSVGGRGSLPIVAGDGDRRVLAEVQQRVLEASKVLRGVRSVLRGRKMNWGY